MRQFKKTLAALVSAGLGLAGASGAWAYQYPGPKTLVSVSRACQSAGYAVPLSNGQGVAVHIKGLVPYFSGPTELMTLSNAQGGSAYRVTSVKLSITAVSGQQIAATVSRTINGPNGTSIIPYDIVDPIYSQPGGYSTPMRQDGQNKPYRPIDIWFYVFKNSTWIESQSGPSPLASAYDALTLFGFGQDTTNLSINVLSSCGYVPSQSRYAPSVDVYTLDYAPFQQTLDGQYAKSDHPVTPDNTVDHVPFIDKGPRLKAAAF